ncbi:hypothetical protein J2741_001393 [Methanolinea mesophila]|uniref:DUF2953 domain-containing protein n=1 Tax=Methanolinea mesophila TaxID=547055 RepID=UPI001AE85894|nr:DUF2953 domain-containing protein [Methanolinea mesophila]MBP1928846.1 hypothetical protein [Methanolinea mesophila]
MDPYLPVLFALIGAICLFYYLLWRIPLVIGLLAERYGEYARAEFRVGWGLAGILMAWTGGELLFSVLVGKKQVYTAPFTGTAPGFIPGMPPERHEAKHPEEEWLKTGREAWRLGGLVRTLGVLLRFGTRARSLLRAMWHATSLERLDCDVTVGLSGAAETGRFFGAYSALRPFLFLVPDVSVEVTPVFTHPVLEGKADCRIRVSRPLTLVILAIGLALTPEFRELVAAFRQGGSE